LLHRTYATATGECERAVPEEPVPFFAGVTKRILNCPNLRNRLLPFQRSTVMRTASFLVLTSVFLPALMLAAAPAGWKPMLSDDKKCEAMVPAAWGKAVTGVGMQVPAGRSHAMASLETGSMADQKATMHMMYTITKTIEDSAGRYWVETAPAGSMRQWHVAVPGSGGVCTAFIAFDNTLSESDAKVIAASLKKH
jgi:hypothetical protein